MAALQSLSKSSPTWTHRDAFPDHPRTVSPASFVRVASRANRMASSNGYRAGFLASSPWTIASSMSASAEISKSKKSPRPAPAAEPRPLVMDPITARGWFARIVASASRTPGKRFASAAEPRVGIHAM